ncbi:hypothetical protein KCX83_03695 [Brucella oryzae]|uniref:hypothetical protein n=1 Tax=Brucella oryzae TaxID=335286 RepID=UPI001B810E08|nr:hypothetical protein [Brucella oryzae]MBR7651422.1 hypothetical protein [Brucella oryzae]
MTPLQLLEARIATMEEHIKRLEEWTGFDEEICLEGEVASIDERSSVQELIIRHLLKLLESHMADFSLERFAASLHKALATKVAESGESAFNAEIEEGLGRIIDDIIGVPRRRSKTGKSRPVLVATNRDEPPQRP